MASKQPPTPQPLPPSPDEAGVYVLRDGQYVPAPAEPAPDHTEPED